MRFLFIVLGLLVATLTTPAAAQSPVPDPTGDWRGTLAAGDATLRVALHIGPVSTFHSPDQGVLGLPAEVTIENGRVTATITGVGVFEGELSTDGQSLDGVLKQGPTSLPLHFERGVFSAANRPQTPRPPYPYNVEEVAYDNPEASGVHLTGTLTTPPSGGPFPVVLLITGSGAQDRDETLFEHKPFLVLADALTRHGIAVLRVDDRGVGGSSQGPGDATSADFATDVQAGLSWLRSRDDIDHQRIGLLGHSEGALIAPLVASRDAGVSFVVLWAGPGVSGKDTIVGQVRALALASGATTDDAARAAATQAAILDAVLAAPDAARLRIALDQLTAGGRAPAIPDATLAPLNSPWYRYFLAYDPRPVLRTIKVPMLALLGGNDAQVPVAENEPALREALAGNKYASVEVLPGLNHLFQTAATGSVSEYAQIEETVAPLALNRIVDWIAEQTVARGPT